MEVPTRPLGVERNNAKPDFSLHMMHLQTDLKATSSKASQIESSDGSSFFSVDGLNNPYNSLSDISPGMHLWPYSPPAVESESLVVLASTEPGSGWKASSPDQTETFHGFSWLAEEIHEDNLVNVAGPCKLGATFLRRSDSKTCSKVGLSNRDTQDDVSDVRPSTFPLDSPRDELAWDQIVIEQDDFEGFYIYDESQREPSEAQKQISPCTSSAELHLENKDQSQILVDSASLSSSFLSDSVTKSKSRKRKSETFLEIAATTCVENKEQKKSAEKDFGGATVDTGADSGNDKEETKQLIARFFYENPLRKKECVNGELEPRYAIKTKTDTDVMDDGYRWRKYGQKSVKNSPHPRNYYRCTAPHCPVRKRVERSKEDPDLVMTTYEGRHTHQSPSSCTGPAEYPGGLSEFLGNLYNHYSLGCNQAVVAFLSNRDGFGLSDLLFSSQGLSSYQYNMDVIRAQELLKLQWEAACASIFNEPLQFGAQYRSYRHQEGAPTNPPCSKLPNVTPLSDLSPLFEWQSSSLEQIQRLYSSNV